MTRPCYPFAALVGQDQLKLALVLAALSPQLAGVLIRGEKGTAKSTAVRGLAELLPAQKVVRGCPFRSDPGDPAARTVPGADERDLSIVDQVPASVVELPVGATEDRVIGTLDLEYALSGGQRRFEPGILAAAHRGILYVDEVNLLDDHVVDILLDSAAMGVVSVEREGVSVSHPARFSLVGTMNPEEGELRPQLLDRFGMCVTVTGCTDVAQRVDIMRRRADFERNPDAFRAQWQPRSDALRQQIATAATLLPDVTLTDEHLLIIARTCIKTGVDGHRGDLMMARAACALAAWNGSTHVCDDDLDQAAALVLPHRTRRSPLQKIDQSRPLEAIR